MAGEGCGSGGFDGGAWPGAGIVRRGAGGLHGYRRVTVDVTTIPSYRPIQARQGPSNPRSRHPFARNRILFFLGRCNIAAYCLTNSPLKTPNCSGSITAFLGIIASAKYGGEAKLVQRGPVRARIPSPAWRGVLWRGYDGAASALLSCSRSAPPCSPQGIPRGPGLPEKITRKLPAICIENRSRSFRKNF